MTNTPDELERAVERAMEKRDRPSSHTLGITTLAIADFDTIMNALSERAELMAAVERMRGGLTDAASAFDLVVEILESYGDNTTARVMKMKAQQTRAVLTTGEGK